MNKILPSGETLLTALIDTSDVALIKQVISNGADTRKPNRYGVTPLGAAIRQGDHDVVRVLLENGAHVNQASRFGFSPLQIALSNQKSDIVKLLLRHGAEVNGLPDGSNMTSEDALSIALHWQDVDILQALLDHGANVHNKIISKALHCETESILPLILSHLHGDLSQFSNSCSFLSIAAQIHDCQKVKVLLQAGAKLTFDVPNQDGDCCKSWNNVLEVRKDRIPPLAACVHYDCRSCFDLMLSIMSRDGAAINYADEFKLTPLCHALLDTQWTCYPSIYETRQTHIHTTRTCSLRIHKDMSNNFMKFPLSTKRLEYARDFLLRGADIKVLFNTGCWSISERTHLETNERALHLCLQAYHPNLAKTENELSESHEKIRISQLFRSVGLASDFHGILLLYLTGYTPNSSEIKLFSNKLSSSLSHETQVRIEKFCNDLITSPRSLQNLAVIAIRQSLALGSNGKHGNILHAASKLQIPQGLHQRVTLETYSGLVSNDMINQVCSIHRKLR